MEWLQVAPKTKPKATGGEEDGTKAIAVPESKPKAAGGAIYVPKTGCNKAKDIPTKLHAGKRIETWPNVSCDTTLCSTVKRWNLMFEERKVLHQGRDVLGDDEDADEVSYFCNTCMSIVWGMTPEAAQAKIIAERPGFQKATRGQQAFQ